VIKSVLFIGVILRDSHGVSQVKIVTGNKILRILKAKGLCMSVGMFVTAIVVYVTGLAPDLPEDLYHMIKKAVAIRKHLERHRKVGSVWPSDCDNFKHYRMQVTCRTLCVLCCVSLLLNTLYLSSRYRTGTQSFVLFWWRAGYTVWPDTTGLNVC